MTEDWRTFRIEELSDGPRGMAMGPFGSNIKSEFFVRAGVPVIRGKNLGNGSFHDDGFVYISEEHAEKLATSEARPGDLVFTHRGTIGQVARIPEKSRYPRYIASQSQMRARFSPDKADSRYMHYWFQSPLGQFALLSNATQTGVPAIARPLSHLKSITLQLPDLCEQRRIAGVLGALDDLIDTNLGIAQSLKDLALSYFQEFLQASSAEAVLGDLVTVNGSKAKPYGDDSILYLDIASLGDGFISWPQDRVKWNEAPSRARRLAPPGATLWSTVRPNRRAHALLTRAPENLVVSTGIAVLEPIQIGPAQLFALVDGDDFVDYLTSRSEGSAYPAVSSQVFEEAPVTCLFGKHSDRYESIAWPMWQQVEALEQENTQLRQTRDELLPLLMSGKIRVREAEELVKERVG